jgi:hypothetical protein
MLNYQQSAATFVFRPRLNGNRAPGGQVAAHYIDSFEPVWDTAKPCHGEGT